VSDDESPTGGSFANWALVIVTTNNPPSIAAIPSQSMSTGGQRTVNLAATDGEGDPLVFSESLPNFITLVDNGDGTAQLRLRPEAGDAGTYNNLRVQVDDGEFSTSQAFNLTVTDGTPPDTSAAVIPAPNAAGWNNTNATVQLTATDADSGVNFIRFRATGAQTIPSTDDPGPAADVAVNTNGVTTVLHRAQDGAGNLSAEKDRTVRIDKDKPTLVVGIARAFRLAQLGAGDAMPLQVAGWAFQDSGSGLSRYRLRVSVDGGDQQPVELPGPLATSANVLFESGRTYRHTVDAFDVADNLSDPFVAPTFSAHLVQEGNGSISYSPGWVSVDAADVSGGSHRATNQVGQTATFTFNGGHVAWAAILCPNCGIAEVRVDGGAPVTIDLFNAARTTRRIVFSRSGLSNANHTLEIRSTGNQNPASGGRRVDVDAMAFLDVQ
jgi:hypothetical protein